MSEQASTRNDPPEPGGALQERPTSSMSEAERFRSFFDDAPLGKSMTAPDGRLLRVNPALGRMLGYTVEELQAGSFPSITHPDDLPESRECVRALLAGERDTWTMQKRYLRRDGQPIWTEVWTKLHRDTAGRPEFFLTHVQDITARRQLEAEVARHRRELETRNRIAEVFLTRHGDDMYFGVLQILLDAFRSPFGVFGYVDDAGALVVPSMTRHIWDQCGVDGKDVVFPREQWGDSIWPTAIRNRRILHSNERSTRTPAGHIPVLRNISAPLIHRDRVVGLFQVANKETDYDADDLALARTIADALAPILDARLGVERERALRRRAEEDLRRANEALRRSNRELEQFAYVASHDLQEPLRMVASYTQLLARRYGDQLDREAHDFIGFAVDGANRMQRLIQDLLTYSRVTTRSRPAESIDPHDALGEAVRNLQTAIRESGALVTNGELPRVRADHTQLVQLFQNLLGNAIKFRRPETPPRVHVSAEAAEDAPGFHRFRVTDNGIGIEPRHFERLFVIFQRLHGRNEYPGTGIGLALCKRIVERHGGTIALESQVGVGSTVVFTLPTPDADPEGGHS